MSGAEELERVVRNFQAGVAADMKAAGIHVGLGTPPICCACDEPWPCSTEQRSK